MFDKKKDNHLKGAEDNNDEADLSGDSLSGNQTSLASAMAGKLRKKGAAVALTSLLMVLNGPCPATYHQDNIVKDLENQVETVVLSEHDYQNELREHFREVSEDLEDASSYLATGSLEGRKFSGLYSSYTGIEGAIPGVVEPDFESLLQRMWEEKIRRSQDNLSVSDFVSEQASAYSWEDSSRMSLDEYMEEMDSVIDSTTRALDWDMVSRIKLIGREETSLLKDIVSSLGSRDMLSYSLTELMPSYEGNLNRDVFDFLLRNAGREYVELIPAMHDDYLSFGPYQLTRYAVFEGETKTGLASLINPALPKDLRLPDKLQEIEGEEHHKAAYLMVLNNMANLIRFSTDLEKDVLEESWQENIDDIVSYLAVAHHAPSAARESAKRWLRDGAEYEITSYLPGYLRAYSIKTQKNRSAL